MSAVLAGVRPLLGAYLKVLSESTLQEANALARLVTMAC